MPARVVDASVLAAVLFGEDRAQEADALIGDAELYEPRLLTFELANIAVKKARLFPDRAADFADGLVKTRGIDFRWVELEPGELFHLARATGLSAYDAAYLAVARQTGAELVTFDARLQAASRNVP